MARYIDLEELERRIKKHVKPEIPEEKAFVEYCKDECIRQGYAMPTADVVPKSEVAKIFEEIEEAADYFKERHGFNAIAHSFKEYIDKLKKKYTEGKTDGKS